MESCATGLRTAVPPPLLELLDALDEWRTPAELARRFPELGRAGLARAVRALRARGLVEGASARRRQEALLDAWGAWSPAAALLHFGTKDAPYAAHARGERDLALRQRGRPAPPPLKRTPGAPFTALPEARSDGEFASVLLGRRTWRRFARGPLSLDTLGSLLGLTFGVQGWMDLGPFGRAPLKTSPSGGARHSIEAYVLARDVDGLRPALYHYDAGRHGLERLPGRAPRSAAAWLPAQPWFAGAPVIVAMAAVFGRVQWRYPHPRAYRVVLAEAGHLGQTFCLAATWLGLAPFCTMALADTAIEADLGLDGVGESVLYVAGAGRRPRGQAGQRPRRVSSPRLW